MALRVVTLDVPVYRRIILRMPRRVLDGYWSTFSGSVYFDVSRSLRMIGRFGSDIGITFELMGMMVDRRSHGEIFARDVTPEGVFIYMCIQWQTMHPYPQNKPSTNIPHPRLI
jgi:hypothetical protein